MEQDDTVVYDLSDFTKLREEGRLNNEKKAPLVNPVREYTLDGKFIRMWNSINQVATAFGVSHNAIHSCIRGKKLSVKGRIFLQVLDKIEDRMLLIQKESLFRIYCNLPKSHFSFNRINLFAIYN